MDLSPEYWSHPQRRKIIRLVLLLKQSHPPLYNIMLLHALRAHTRERVCVCVHACQPQQNCPGCRRPLTLWKIESQTSKLNPGGRGNSIPDQQWLSLSLPHKWSQRAWEPCPPCRSPVPLLCQGCRQLVPTMMSMLAWWVLRSAHLPNESLNHLISSCSDNSVLVASAIDWNTREKISIEPMPWHLLFTLRWGRCAHLANASK